MSFFQKLKRKKGSDDQTKAKDKQEAERAPSEVESSPPEPPQDEPEEEEEEETQPVEMASSIFSGLTLSKVVRKKEGTNSPYLQRAADLAKSPLSDGSQSPFAFLGGSTDEDPVSQDDGLGSAEGSKSSFGFLNDSKGVDAQTSAASSTTQEDGPEATQSAFGFIASESASVKDGSTDDPKSKEELQVDDTSSTSVSSSFSFLNQSAREPADSSNSNTDSLPKKVGGLDSLDSAVKEASLGILSETRSPHVVPPSPIDNKPDSATDSDSISSTPRRASGTSSSLPSFQVAAATSPTTKLPAGSKPSPSQHVVGKQKAPAGRKKKRTAVRPGQARTDDSFSTLLEAGSHGRTGTGKDADSLSVSSQVSSLDGGRESVCSSTSEQKLTAEETKEETSPSGSPQPPLSVARSPMADEGNRKGPLSLGAQKTDTQSSKTAVQQLVDISSDSRAKSKREKQQEREPERPPALKEPDSRADDLEAGSSEQRLLAEVFSKESSPMPQAAETANYEVELSPSDRLTALLQTSENHLGNIRSSLTDVQTERKKLLEEHLASARQQIERRAHMKELKSKEARALLEEDYELAEELSRELESISLRQEWIIAADSQSTLKEWVSQCSELMESEISLQEDIQRQLVEMKNEQTSLLSDMDEEFASLLAKEKMRFKTLEDKIARQRGHIALDREHLAKREQLLQEEVDRRSAKFVASKKRLQEECETVKSEMAVLEAKLAELRAKEQEVLGHIGEEEGQIQAVHEELALENGQLAEERKQVQSREEEFTKEVENLNEVKSSFEETQQKQEAKKLGVGAMISTVERRMSQAEARGEGLRQSLRHCDSGTLGGTDIAELLKPSGQLQSLKEKLHSKDTAMKELTSHLLSLQSDIGSLRRKIADSEAQLPQLQEAKKAAVTARQYKEAARIASEIKSLEASVESEQERIKEAESELAAKNKELSHLNQELSSVREDVDSREKEEDVEHIQQLMKTAQVLNARLSSLPDSVTTPLHEVLQYWYQLHQLLAKDLCAKHDLTLSDFTPEERTAEIESPELEGELEPDSTTAVEQESDLSQHSEKEPPDEERTPGVGMELEALPSDPSPSLGEAGTADSTHTQEMRERLTELEADIDAAVNEENYERAAELDEELQALKKMLRTV